MTKILIQFDTDEYPNSFDAIVAYDAGAEKVLPYGGVTPEKARHLVQDALLSRDVDNLSTIAVHIGGEIARGEEVLTAILSTFSGPSQVSVMLDCDGYNTAAASAVATLAKWHELTEERAVVIGLGPLGLRLAKLLRSEGCPVLAASIPRDLLLGQSYRRPRGLDVARELQLDVTNPTSQRDLEAALDDASLVICAAPAGVQVLREEFWRPHPTLRTLVDFSSEEPLGIGGIDGSNDQALSVDGKVVATASAIARLKTKVQRACVGRLFERSPLVLDAEGIYAVAKEIL